METYSYMYVTTTYDQFYVYIITNESLYNLADHKNIFLIFPSMYVTNTHFYCTYSIYMYNNKTWRTMITHICVLRKILVHFISFYINCVVLV